jgi:hypothetical protein
MKYFPLSALFSALLLAGCTDADWDHAMTYTGLEGARTAEAAEAPPASVPVPAAASDDGFCEAVAKQDATGGEFDPATQARILQRSFRQCVAMFATASPAVAANAQ